METKIEIDKLREEYNGMLKELEILKEKYSIADKECKAITNKIDDLNNKIDNLENEMSNSANAIIEEKKKYIENKQIKIVKLTTIIAIISAFTFGRLPFYIEKSAVSFLANVFFTSAIYFLGSSLILSAFLYNSKVNNIFINKFKKTESYSKYKELFSTKEQEVTILKNEKIKVNWNSYQSYEAVRKLNFLIADKEAEIEEFKKKVFALLFAEPKEKSIAMSQDSITEEFNPLVKTRKKIK